MFYLLSSALLGFQQPSTGRMDDPQTHRQAVLQVGTLFNENAWQFKAKIIFFFNWIIKDLSRSIWLCPPSLQTLQAPKMQTDSWFAFKTSYWLSEHKTLSDQLTFMSRRISDTSLGSAFRNIKLDIFSFCSSSLFSLDLWMWKEAKFVSSFAPQEYIPCQWS